MTEYQPSKQEGPSDELVESRTLRRKLIFWRRVAGSSIGIVLVIVMVLWQRGHARQQECRMALEYYAQFAQSGELAGTSPALLRAQWDNLRGEAVFRVSPSQYRLIIENWGITPTPGKQIPLAVRRNALSLLYTKGRHVLFRDENGYHVEWLSENEARPIVAKAVASQAPRQTND